MLAPTLVACAITATAPPPTPNLPDARPLQASALLEMVDAPEEQVCSKHEGLKKFCVSGFRSALTPGLQKVVSRFFQKPESGEPVYRARFKLIEFSHSPTTGGEGPAVQVAMRWQFTIKRNDGTTVIDLAETTTGPQQAINVDAGSTVIAALDNAVLERVAKALGDARDRLESSPGKPAAEASSPEARGPDGVSGFNFGVTLRQVESTCTESGQSWSAENDVFKCSKMPWSLPVSGEVVFAFCAAQLCRIELVTPEDTRGNESLRAVLKLRQLLVEKYGRPTETNQSIPDECAQNAGPCLAAGTAVLEYTWTFSDKKAIRLLGKKEEQGVRVRLVYDHDSQDRTRGL